MTTEVRSHEQYYVVHSEISGKRIFSVWEPADQESQYEAVKTFDRGVYGRLGTRLTAVESIISSKEFMLEQINRAKNVISKTYPDIKEENIQVGPAAFLMI